ncbi:MAG: 1,4-dihydroxy-6-naphthoate synthase [Proteobacteria bacterium]|nr:1,4-dihydroxy-6-naphthoate synthase [Pseudomonadota bacterium]MBU1649552.1 1,4-dihydroxy-6-naphthoate synthase [Pseudomonadota bacterium]MBU1986047.1 1,4-dihydroxy-6-naphthoate synthase [Pseudomonadota bacterium]
MKPLTRHVTIGYSPCPNDTFIFYALTHGKIDLPGVELADPVLEDVETLNGWALEHRLDVTKLSFHALGHVLDEYCVLSSGSALGRGCGPLLVARRPLDLSSPVRYKIAIPGRLTTAALLFRLFLPGCPELVEMRFDTIMNAVQQGEVDAGVIIHESRFTYQQMGLVCLQDLGQWWEQTTGYPIPLGCIAARRSLGRKRIAAIDQAIRASIDWASAHPEQCLPYIREHAQELEDRVVQDHIGLYVNNFSRELGVEGMAAIDAFLERGRSAGILPHSCLGLQCGPE